MMMDAKPPSPVPVPVPMPVPVSRTKLTSEVTNGWEVYISCSRRSPRPMTVAWDAVRAETPLDCKHQRSLETSPILLQQRTLSFLFLHDSTAKQSIRKGQCMRSEALA